MSCAQWEERIADEIGGEFSAAVEGHLRSCPACNALANDLESDRLALAAASPEADVDYTAMRRGIRAAIVRQQRVRRYVPALLAAAAAIVALALTQPRTPVGAAANASSASRHGTVESPSSSASLIAGAVPATSLGKSFAQPSKHAQPGPVSKHRHLAQPLPPIDLALLRKVTGQEPAPETGSESPVEMRIATANPNVTIILLQAKDVSYE